MGCAPSKKSVCRNCNAQCSPVRRSYSSYAHHSPPRDGDNHHVVALTSTTLGYLLLEQSKPNQVRQDPAVAERCQEPVRGNVPEKNSNDFAVGVIEAETWSKMIDEKIAKITPKTPIQTPPGEPETINSWELMEGLDDSSPLLLPSEVDHNGRFSFNVNSISIPLEDKDSTLTSQEKDHQVEVLHKPLWLQFSEIQSDSKSNSDDTLIASDFDLNTINVTQSTNENQPFSNSIGDDANKPSQKDKKELTSHGKEKLILYFTSLRGVRKTYEDCCHVRVILKSTGVRVDERDVSMHSGFKEELKELLGDQFGGGGLPKVFVGKKFMGGADEIRRLHDEFQLEKALEGCETADDGCGACGDIRFLPCEKCSGSCKIYNEVNSDGGKEEEEEESDYGFQRCPDCNENGLVRCPICCD